MQSWPKTIELTTVAIFVSLIAPAYINEKTTHKYVFIVINGAFALTMSVSFML